ncbi:MAG TPA: hypothetical protein VFU30_10695 [Gaiellaceae bacterium]|nr:hypothetical protein [Gaiellaceae bacterium]
MGFFSKLREALAGPPHISGGDDPGETAAALHEEHAVPNPGEEEAREIDSLSDAGAPAAPLAAAPFAGAGQIRATELEEQITEAEDVVPDETEVRSDEDLIDPDR